VTPTSFLPRVAGEEEGGGAREMRRVVKTRSIKTDTGVGKPATPLRVLIAKVGLDGHDRGVKIVARALRDAGMEVIYLGIHNTPEEIASSALQEDVDAIGLSIHSAAHMTLFGEVLGLLKKKRARDIAIFGGGIVPQEDIRSLKKMGVKEIFTPGAPLDEIVNFVRALPPRKRNAHLKP
jgi:methylmalonyl-CoA mutase C-terminal domain/subunit